MQNSRLGNGAIGHLLKLNELTALNLSQSRVTSEAVVALGCLPKLQVGEVPTRAVICPAPRLTAGAVSCGCAGGAATLLPLLPMLRLAQPLPLCQQITAVTAGL